MIARSCDRFSYDFRPEVGRKAFLGACHCLPIGWLAYGTLPSRATPRNYLTILAHAQGLLGRRSGSQVCVFRIRHVVDACLFLTMRRVVSAFFAHLHQIFCQPKKLQRGIIFQAVSKQTEDVAVLISIVAQIQGPDERDGYPHTLSKG